MKKLSLSTTTRTLPRALSVAAPSSGCRAAMPLGKNFSRCYATKRSSMPKAPKRRLVSSPQDSPSPPPKRGHKDMPWMCDPHWGPASKDLGAMFMQTHTELPEMIKSSGMQHQPEDYIDCINKFESVMATSNHKWPYQFKEADRPSPLLIHETACLVTSWGSPMRLQNIIPGLWAGSSEMGFVPSTLSLILLFRRAKLWALHSSMKAVHARFHSLVVDDKDARAIAIEGILAFDKGEDSKAIGLFEKALALDKNGDVYRTGCHGFLGELYVKVKRQEEGIEHLRKAFEKGMLSCGKTLYRLVEDRDEAEAFLYGAAFTDHSMFGELANMEIERKGMTKEETEDAYKMAAEWTSIAEFGTKA